MTTPEATFLEDEDAASRGASGPAEQPPAVKGGAFLLEPVLRPVFSREMFTDEQLEIERMVRQLAQNRIAPHAEELETPNRELTMELMRECAELGLTAVDIPEKYGGMALRKSTSALVVESLTTCGSASWMVTFSCHVGIGSLPIVFFGTDEQKERYLPKLASVELLGAYALTEPDSGSDVTVLKTTARPTEDGSGFVLDGNKMWITNGGWADLFVVFANLEGAGVTAFLVEGDTAGLSRGAEEHKMGIKGSSTTAIQLDGVHIPKENLLGEPGGGLPIALNVLNVGRFKLGAADLGGCKTVVDQATRYALDRHQFGQPIAFFEAIRKKLADMVARTYMLDSAIYRTVGLMDDHISRLDAEAPDYPGKVMAALEEYAIESSISKILGSECMARIADHGVQIYGGYGFSEEYPMARVYRDARIDRLFEGTNEINRMVVYGYFLKKALTEELPLRALEPVWDRPAGRYDSELDWEFGRLDLARRLIAKSLLEAVSIYGQDLRNAQIVGEDLADLIIGDFSASAAINRLHQRSLGEPLDHAHRSLARLIVATYLEDVVRLMYRLRPVLFGDAYGKRSISALDRQLALLQLDFDPVKEIETLTDDLFDRGGYRFEQGG